MVHCYCHWQLHEPSIPRSVHREKLTSNAHVLMKHMVVVGGGGGRTQMRRRVIRKLWLLWLFTVADLVQYRAALVALFSRRSLERDGRVRVSTSQKFPVSHTSWWYCDLTNSLESAQLHSPCKKNISRTLLVETRESPSHCRRPNHSTQKLSAFALFLIPFFIRKVPCVDQCGTSAPTWAVHWFEQQRARGTGASQKRRGGGGRRGDSVSWQGGGHPKTQAFRAGSPFLHSPRPFITCPSFSARDAVPKNEAESRLASMSSGVKWRDGTRESRLASMSSGVKWRDSTGESRPASMSSGVKWRESTGESRPASMSSGVKWRDSTGESRPASMSSGVKWRDSTGESRPASMSSGVKWRDSTGESRPASMSSGVKWKYSTGESRPASMSSGVKWRDSTGESRPASMSSGVKWRDSTGESRPASMSSGVKWRDSTGESRPASMSSGVKWRDSTGAPASAVGRPLTCEPRAPWTPGGPFTPGRPCNATR